MCEEEDLPCPCFVDMSRCRCFTENEKREITRDDIEREVCASTHTLGRHTLLQTLAVTQMWRQEVITRGSINRSGRHAHTHTHTHTHTLFSHTHQCSEGLQE